MPAIALAPAAQVPPVALVCALFPGCVVRPSRRSPSGWVAVVPASAAPVWARRLPAGCRGVVVRRGVASLPVQVA